MSDGRGPTYYVKTWGCQMNVQDEQRIVSLLEADGYAPADSPAEADVLVLNTCSVREKSAEKFFGFLGRLKRLKSRSEGKVIAVAGCVAQQEGERIFARAPHVDLVLGPRRIGKLPILLPEARRRRTVDTTMDDLEAIYWEGGERPRTGPKAFVTVMEGCNMGCTFCIVPRTRGREVHRDFESIVEECRRRLAAGAVELELLGQTVNAYHAGPRRFDDLLAAVAELPGLARLRFTSSHPAFFTRRTARVMAEHGAICPHLHLPAQSGSDTVLARMRRGYRRADYLSRLEFLRAAIPHLAVSTDIIVGYPGETEAEFEATLALLREVRFSQVYAFAYSPRPETAAAETPDDVASEVKSERLAVLFELQDRIAREENEALVGSTLPVLFDGGSRKDGRSASGRTPCHRVMNVDGAPAERLLGRILPVRVVQGHPHSLMGALAEPASGLTSP